MAAATALGLAVAPTTGSITTCQSGTCKDQKTSAAAASQLCRTSFFGGHPRTAAVPRRQVVHSTSVSARHFHFEEEEPRSSSVNSVPVGFEQEEESSQPIWKTAFGLAAATLLLSSGLNERALADDEFKVYYGTAASASSYGGYGGNSNKQDSAEYVYDVPSGWKERAISKVEKGTNGTDSEFYNPKKKTEKVYVTFLAGFRRLAPQDIVLNNLALSDVTLQDAISSADKIAQTTRETDGQVYYDYEIDSPLSHQLITVTCAKNKLYAHFVSAPVNDWQRDSSMLERVHSSFKTVGRDPLGM